MRVPVSVFVPVVVPPEVVPPEVAFGRGVEPPEVDPPDVEPPEVGVVPDPPDEPPAIAMSPGAFRLTIRRMPRATEASPRLIRVESDGFMPGSVREPLGVDAPAWDLELGERSLEAIHHREGSA